MIVVRDGGVMLGRVVCRGVVTGRVTRLWSPVCPYPMRGEAPAGVMPPLVVGQRLWLREFCRAVAWETGQAMAQYRADGAFARVEDGDAWRSLRKAKAAIWDRWVHPSVMPRWAARFEVTPVEVSLERLQALDSEDVSGAGIWYSEGRRGWTRDGQMYSPTARKAFARWWDGEHAVCDGGRGWVSDPWVWKSTLKVER